MAVEVILTIASVGSSIRGSGTSSICTSRLPCQVTARMLRSSYEFRTCRMTFELVRLPGEPPVWRSVAGPLGEIGQSLQRLLVAPVQEYRTQRLRHQSSGTFDGVLEDRHAAAGR